MEDADEAFQIMPVSNPKSLVSDEQLLYGKAVSKDNSTDGPASLKD